MKTGTPIALESAKWWSTIKISWSRLTSYRMDFFLQVIGPALVLFFVQYNLWSSIYKSNQSVNGYNLSQMLEYHLWSMLVILLGQGLMAFDLSNDIRYGRISSYLVYPFDFWKFHAASFLSFQSMQMFICVFTLILALASGLASLHSWQALIAGTAYTLLVSVFWFALQFLTGIMAFWLEETWILRVIAQILTRFLSGALIPLEFFPDWARLVLQWTPFPLLTYLPINIFTGKATIGWENVSLLLGWLIVLIALNRWLWKRGMKLYTAAGM